MTPLSRTIAQILDDNEGKWPRAFPGPDSYEYRRHPGAGRGAGAPADGAPPAPSAGGGEEQEEDQPMTVVAGAGDASNGSDVEAGGGGRPPAAAPGAPPPPLTPVSLNKKETFIFKTSLF